MNKERKRNRLKDFDYSESGYYFITICTNDRVEIFGNIVDGKMLLNTCGKIIQKQWLWLSAQYDYIKLDQYVVMPNHIHGIIIIDKNGYGDNRCGDNPRIVPTDTIYNPRKNLLSKTICAFKTTSSKLIHRAGIPDFKWQRSFYDHIIRNEKSLLKIREYIINNPLKWEYDSENLDVIKK